MMDILKDTRYAELVQADANFDWCLRRMAFIQEWSDAIIVCALKHVQGDPAEVLAQLQSAADDFAVSTLRGGDVNLANAAAQKLGFRSADEMASVQRENPMLSQRPEATAQTDAGGGYVVGVSLTEVVFANEQGLRFIERAWLRGQDVNVGDRVDVERFSVAHASAGVEASVYEPGRKYQGLIPEIKFLPVSAIERAELDFRPEVMTVSDEVAQNMDYSEPVEVTAFRYSWASNDVAPEVLLKDGHHRTAAAIQTNKPYLPVVAKAINAKGEKLNALIAMSRAIELALEPTASSEMTG